MVTLIWNDLRHHARQWLWSLLVATVGGAIIGVIITAWYSALSWALSLIHIYAADEYLFV